MCMFGNNSSTPPPVAPIQPLPAPVDPTAANKDATTARNDVAKKAKAVEGMASTNETSPLGITEKANTRKPGLSGLYT